MATLYPVKILKGFPLVEKPFTSSILLIAKSDKPIFINTSFAND
jgi:hypothetical protein